MYFCGDIFALHRSADPLSIWLCRFGQTLSELLPDTVSILTRAAPNFDVKVLELGSLFLDKKFNKLDS